MKAEIDSFKPDLIGLYMHTPGYYVALDLIDELKGYLTHPDGRWPPRVSLS